MIYLCGQFHKLVGEWRVHTKAYDELPSALTLKYDRLSVLTLKYDRLNINIKETVISTTGNRYTE